MGNTAQTILQQALQLEPIDRAFLIDKLIQSFDDKQDPFDDRDTLWKEEAESRIDAFNEGKISADLPSQVFKRINQR